MKRLLKRCLSGISILTIAANVFAANLDNPLPPVNPTATMSDDFSHVTLTWGYPGDIGENGGIVDSEKITYYIFDAFGSYYDPALAVTKATSYEFDYSNLQGQDFVAYQLTAGMDETWYSLPVNSNIVCVGQPQNLPFIETFESGKQAYPWCVDPNSSVYVNSSISKDDNKPYGEPDNGCLTITTKKTDQTYSITSVKTATDDEKAIQLKISVRGKNADLVIDKTYDGGEGAHAASITPDETWQLITVDLGESVTSKYLQLTFSAEFHSSDAWISIDDIKIEDNQSGGKQITLPDESGAKTDYFTIDGHRLPCRPTAPGLYISRDCEKTTKILVR